MEEWLGLNSENTDLGGKLPCHHDPDQRLIEANGNSPPSRLPQVQASPGRRYIFLQRLSHALPLVLCGLYLPLMPSTNAFVPVTC